MILDRSARERLLDLAGSARWVWLHPDMPHDPAADYFHRFAERADLQNFSREFIGCPQDPVPIWSRRSALPDAPVVFLSAGIHGDEQSGPEALLRFLETWTCSAGLHWVIAPLLNPAGFRQTTRGNAAGIDLNRDFLRCQCRETRGLMEWWQRQPLPCTLHISLHEDWEAEGFYLYEIDTSASRQSLSAGILASVAALIPLQETGPVDGHLLAAPGLIVHEPVADEPDGWPEAIWLTRTWPMRSYTLEAPGQVPSSMRVECLLAALRGAFSRL